MFRAHALLWAARGTFAGRALPLATAAAAARLPPLSLSAAAVTVGLANAAGGGFRLTHIGSSPPEQRQSGGADGGAADMRSRATVGGEQRREANGRDMPKQRNSSGRLSSDSGRASRDASPASELASCPPFNREARHRQKSNRRQSNQPQSTHRSAESHAHPPHIATLLRQLSQLQQKYMRTFPTTNLFGLRHYTSDGTGDVTSKTEWVTMQQESKQLLDDLLSLASRGDYRVQWREWKEMLHAMKQFRLYGLALPFYAVIRQQHDPPIQQWRVQQQQSSSSTDCGSSAAVPPPLPSELRMPLKCTAMLLECVAKGATAAECMAATPPDLQPAVSRLFTLHPPLSLHACGADLAERLLREMRSPGMEERFEWDAGLWNVVLQGLSQLVDRHDTQHRREQIARVRSFYDSIPVRSDFTHSTMLAVYGRARMQEEKDALLQQLQADPAAVASSRIINARLGDIYEKLSSHRMHEPLPLLAEVEQLWRQAAQRPLDSLDMVTTLSMLKLYHYRGDVQRQQSLIIETLNLERSAAAQAIRDADPRWSFERDGPPVFVDAASFCLLFDSFAHSEEPANHVAAAKAVYATMLRRRGEAARRGWHKRELQLIVTESVTNAYLKFLQRAGLADEMLQLWEGMSASDKEGNPRALTGVLNALSSVEGGHLQAERLMEAEASWDVQLVSAWLSCCADSGNWRGAEAVWRRMLERNISPTSQSYRKLMEVCIADGSAAQLAKIESLWAEMRGDSGPAGRPLSMAVVDYKNLIKRAHHCGLPAEVLKWVNRAKELSAWHQMDEASQRIVARCRRAEARRR